MRSWNDAAEIFLDIAAHSGQLWAMLAAERGTDLPLQLTQLIIMGDPHDIRAYRIRCR